jgi:hypothetical protein
MGIEDYMGFSQESFGQWNDTQNNEPWMRFGYFVESEGNASVPEPATVALLGIGLIWFAGVGARCKWKKKAVHKK